MRSSLLITAEGMGRPCIAKRRNNDADTYERVRYEHLRQRQLSLETHAQKVKTLSFADDDPRRRQLPRCAPEVLLEAHAAWCLHQLAHLQVIQKWKPAGIVAQADNGREHLLL